jgi:hypothetical protein
MQKKLKNKLLTGFSAAFFIFLWLKIRLIIYNKGFFPDEIDNFTTGWLISKGRILYKEVFSHHFPLMYFIAALIETFAHQIVYYRYFMIFYELVFWLLIIFILKKEIRFATIISLPLVSWSLIFFGGHQFVSETFFAYSLLGFYLIFINKLWNKKELTFNKLELLLLAYFFFTTLASSIIYLLSFIPFFAVYFYKKRAQAFNKRNFKYFFLPNLLGFVILLGYFVVNKALSSAYWSLFTFNSIFYSKRYGINQNSFFAFFGKIFNDFFHHFYQLFKTSFTYLFIYLKALKGVLVEFVKTNNFSLLKRNLAMIHHQTYQRLFHFEFFVLLFILLGIFAYFKKRKYLALLLSTAFILSARLRFGEMFHLTPYYLYGFWLGGLFTAFALKKLQKKNIIYIFASLIFLISYYFEKKPDFKFATSFIVKNPNPKITKYIKKNTSPDEKISQINLSSSVYYFSQREPANKFIFYYPWVDWAPRLKTTMVSDLKQHQPQVVVVNMQGVKNYQKKYPDTYQQLLNSLTSNYTKAKTISSAHIFKTEN